VEIAYDRIVCLILLTLLAKSSAELTDVEKCEGLFRVAGSMGRRNTFTRLAPGSRPSMFIWSYPKR
jgi:hypothetical protein